MTVLERSLTATVSFLDEHRTPYMLIGGIANLVWGEPRTTRDIDVTVWLPGREREFCRELCRRFRSLADDPERFVEDTRVLPLMVEEFRVDVIFGQLPYEEQAVRRAREVEMAGRRVRVASPEDLILHKIVSERPRDRDDVRGVIRAQAGRLDRAYLDPLVGALARELARPEMQEFYLSCF